MIVDDTLVLSDSQAITATAASTNIIDLAAAGTPYGHTNAVRRDIGIGTDIPIAVIVTEAFNNLTSLSVAIQVDDDPAFGSPKTVATGPAVPLADLAVGRQLPFPAAIPEGVDERFMRFNYTVVGAAPTTGKLFAGPVAGRQTN